MSSKQAVWAVVPAAGIGSRMQAEIPKQYLLIDDKPVLQLTLERLASHPAIEGIVIALAENDQWWPSLSLSLSCELLIAKGGKDRSDSVSNALKLLQQHIEHNPWVLVHDAARPCLRHADIDAMLDTLADDAVGGILGIPVSDTVKRVDANNMIQETVCRQGLWRAATPQMFRLAPLSEALTSAAEKSLAVTDEASAIELAGYQPRMVEGHSDNIKITVPQDLALAALYLRQQAGGN
ncbi:2-C-methyl-D-erythritol 4-phosphate cytidylyltransferase [Methylophaga thalassica]|uniref:2-C-methyl-D-erythritol 4-phosphate cytidylyltransferase n=1 Tax=Methylophaga aminisulfidivorans TaxID=230105 RepID=UPI003A8E716C